MALIKPQVYADVVRQKIAGKVRVGQLAKEFENLEDFRTVSETVNFPKFAFVGSAEELAYKGTITPSDMDMVNSTATITHVAKAVTIYDRDAVSVASSDRLIEEGADQIATAIARKLDTDLITEMYTNAVLKKTDCASATACTQDELLSALGLFGDDRDVADFSEGGIIINSRLMPSMLGMSFFVDATKTMAMAGNGIVKNGLIGYFMGIPVYLSDKDTYVALKCRTFIIKNGAVGYKMKANSPNIEEQRDALKQANNIVGGAMYCVKMVDDSGVILIEKA